MVHHCLFVPDEIDTLMTDCRLNPALKPGCLILQLNQWFRTEQAMLGLPKGDKPKEKRSGQDLTIIATVNQLNQPLWEGSKRGRGREGG